MKILLQHTFHKPGDWIELDHTVWPGLPKKPAPVGGETIDNVPGWCHGLNVQGVIFQADHYHVDGISDGVRITIWNDDPIDFPKGRRHARVWDIKHLAPDAAMGGAINTRQSQIVYGERDFLADLTVLGPFDSMILLPWADFSPPTTKVMHGIEVSSDLHAAHKSIRTKRGWREFTEGVPQDQIVDGKVRNQRSQGKYLLPDGTKTFFLRFPTRATGVHSASFENEAELDSLDDPGTDNVSVPNNSDVLGMIWTTPSGEPNAGTWPTGNYRCQLQVVFADSTITYGLKTLGGSGGHFGRVNTGLTSDLESKVQTEGTFSGTGLKLVTTGSVSWSSGAATDRFECVVACANSDTHGGDDNIIFQSDDLDAFSDGPWTLARVMHHYKMLRD